MGKSGEALVRLPVLRFASEDYTMPAGGVQSPSEVPRGRWLDPISWVLFEQVSQPGAYVCRGTGDLIRVTSSGPAGMESDELIRTHHDEPLYVTRISVDPFIPISQARIAAANLDLTVDF
jgi:hypothetical protein